VSCPIIRDKVCEYIIERVKPKTVFDLGCGVGCYGKELKLRDPKIKMIGADGYLLYLTSAFAIEFYDVLIKAAIKEFIDGEIYVSANLVLFMDVLEHFERKDGEDVLNYIEEYNHAILSTPLFDYPQGAVDGNELERHRTVWTEQELVQRGWTVLFKENWQGGDIGAFIYG
jgi:hypothetical protein